MKTLRLILGDQLNIQHSWYASVSESNVYCMFEMRQETDYVKHHIQKVVGFFAAMRDFSEQLKSRGAQGYIFNFRGFKQQSKPRRQSQKHHCFS